MNAHAETAAREAARAVPPSGRLPLQGRPGTPGDATSSPHPRVVEMAETIREIVFRDGAATEASVIAADFTAEEVAAFGTAAGELARRLMVAEGTAPDDYPKIRAKAEAGGDMPMPGGFVPDRRSREAWSRYVAARRAHALDPWIGQQTRCEEFLRRFLTRLPLLPREVNGIVTSTVGAMKRIEEASR